METFAQTLGFGVIAASILVLAASGLSLQFGVTNYINFAYGTYMTVGAYAAWVCTAVLHLELWLSLILGGFVVAGVALLVSRYVLKYFVLRGGSLLYMLIVTFGVSVAGDNLLLAAFGSGVKQYPGAAQSALHLGPVLLTVNQSVLIAVAVAAMAGQHLLLTRTTLGKSMRAMSDNASLAGISGIDTRRVTDATWLLSGFLAGLAGATLPLSVFSFDSALGSGYLFVVFAAVILGGIGKPYGALLGGCVIGLVTQFAGAYLNPAYNIDFAFGILVVVLLVRPQGILGSRSRTA